ncbi:MAG: hypothetical protein DWP98_04920 [Bacteroidetes bacterium]|nr:MAG: hypothetical protein DWP98_04920 [Bacteroidota bacterium]MBL1143755.1 hypothetical protein [Bacteroidota bacterium]NOG56556.1 hypothetical protein [Bacteroidota bacterium]
MENLMKITLFIHAFSGGISLIAGLIAMLAKKGQKWHLKSGLIYYWGMMAVVITGVILGLYRTNIFILTIAVFSFYLVFTGRRTLAFKKALNPTFIDWFFNLICLLIGLYMLYLAIINFIKIGFASAVPMLFVFGFFLTLMCLQDLRVFLNKKYKKGQWLLTHIGRMCGSYIATSTAFLVVNIHVEPQWIIWLMPTAVGTPLIFRATGLWKKKFGL